MRNRIRVFKRHLAAAFLPDELRFYAAPHLVANGVPITVNSNMLGHALTSTLYNNAHFIPGADRLTAEAMVRLLE